VDGRTAVAGEARLAEDFGDASVARRYVGRKDAARTARLGRRQDPKLRLPDGFLRLRFDRLDPRQRREIHLQTLSEPLDRHRRPLDEDLDPGVAAVPYRSDEAAVDGDPIDERTEPDPLDDAPDEKTNALGGHEASATASVSIVTLSTYSSRPATTSTSPPHVGHERIGIEKWNASSRTCSVDPS